MKDLCDKLTVMKERGNTHYKRQAYKDAIKIFSEAINTFEAAGAPMTDTAIKTVVTQLMTNRSLSFHHLNQQASALSDCNYVLTKLDPSNAKALFRRAHAYKSQEKWELAARDLQELYKENQTKEIKDDMSLCLKKAIDSKKV